MKPIIKKPSGMKVVNYFFGDEYKKYKTIIIGIRNNNNKINLFDDESFTLNVGTGEILTNNFNTDPSLYREKGRGVAILRPGVHPYKISYHHRDQDLKRYVALRPATNGEVLPVYRYDAKRRLTLDYGLAINIHAGGDITTGSRGCQTLPKTKQFPEFIRFVGKSEGVEIPLGIITRKKIGNELFKRFYNGIGNIPYILVTQEQFDYIQRLPESEFDSPDDLRYQQENFVNVPKTQRIQPVLLEARPPEAILSEDDQSADFPGDTEFMDISLKPDAIFEDLKDDEINAVTENLGTVRETVRETIGDGTPQLEKVTAEIKNTFEPTNLPAFIPRFGKQWLLGVIPGAGFLSTLGAWWNNAPQWLVFLLGALTGIALWNFGQLVIKHREKVLEFITECYKKTADPTQNNLIPTDAQGFFAATRQNDLLSSLAPPPTPQRK